MGIGSRDTRNIIVNELLGAQQKREREDGKLESVILVRLINHQCVRLLRLSKITVTFSIKWTFMWEYDVLVGYGKVSLYRSISET